MLLIMEHNIRILENITKFWEFDEHFGLFSSMIYCFVHNLRKQGITFLIRLPIGMHKLSQNNFQNKLYKKAKVKSKTLGQQEQNTLTQLTIIVRLKNHQFYYGSDKTKGRQLCFILPMRFKDFNIDTIVSIRVHTSCLRYKSPTT